MTFGKVMGGGFTAAFGGRADIMRALPVGPVTRPAPCQNPVHCRHTTTLRLATEEVHAHVDRSAAALREQAGKALDAFAVPRHPAHRKPVLGLLHPAGHHRGARLDHGRNPARGRFAAFFHALLANGCTGPSCYEAWFLSAAHDDAALTGS